MSADRKPYDVDEMIRRLESRKGLSWQEHDAIAAELKSNRAERAVVKAARGLHLQMSKQRRFPIGVHAGFQALGSALASLDDSAPSEPPEPKDSDHSTLCDVRVGQPCDCDITQCPNCSKWFSPEDLEVAGAPAPTEGGAG